MFKVQVKIMTTVNMTSWEKVHCPQMVSIGMN